MTTNTTSPTAPAVAPGSWDAPRPGFWEWQGSHVPGVPTPIYAALHLGTMPTAISTMFERYGVPLRTVEERIVNGRMYTSLQPLVGTAGAKPPPKPLLWLVTRLHPAFRRRAKAAARTLEERPWRARTQEWRQQLRPQLQATNLALQSEDIRGSTDAGLADHLDRVHAHAWAGYLTHFDLHGDDLGPLGAFLAGCRQWGIEPGDGITALAGHSPSTRAPLDALGAVAETLGDAEPTSLDALRAVGPATSAALDRYLDEYGWRVVTGYDLDAQTVGELPDALLANVLACRATPPESNDGDAAAMALRARVPAVHRGEFDTRLEEARIALDLRDDNGAMTAEWPVGLLRRAVLEVGRRLVERGQLHTVEHAVELDLDELRGALRGAAVLDPDAIAARAADRAALAAVIPPATLGEKPPDPDLTAFPAPLAELTEMAMTATALLERGRSRVTPEGVAAIGLGVGSTSYTGTARVASSAQAALNAIEPGDVLVVSFTTPAYNSVLAVAGAVVTEEGGVLSHAAVLARELGIPGVIGAAGALGAIPDGAIVHVDPATGTVRVLERDPSAPAALTGSSRNAAHDHAEPERPREDPGSRKQGEEG